MCPNRASISPYWWGKENRPIRAMNNSTRCRPDPNLSGSERPREMAKPSSPASPSTVITRSSPAGMPDSREDFREVNTNISSIGSISDPVTRKRRLVTNEGCNGSSSTRGDLSRYTSIVPPSYPIFLALIFRVFGRSLVVTRLFQINFSALVANIIFEIAHRVYTKEVATLSAIITAVYPA